MTQAEFLRVLTSLIMGKQPVEPDLSVCVECKLNENERACTNGVDLPGLGHARRLQLALAPTSGSTAIGCRGLISEPNLEGMIRGALGPRPGRGRSLEAPSVVQRLPAPGVRA